MGYFGGWGSFLSERTFTVNFFYSYIVLESAGIMHFYLYAFKENFYASLFQNLFTVKTSNKLTRIIMTEQKENYARQAIEPSAIAFKKCSRTRDIQLYNLPNFSSS